MNGQGVKRLRMFTGPNGSGRTTLIETLAREFSPSRVFSLHHYVNADKVYLALQDKGLQFRDYGLTVTWPQLRDALIGAGRLAAGHPFFETGRIDDSRLTVPAADCDAYVAASVADFLREELLACGQSLSFETVMSHPGEIEFFARARA
jgi:predicted ABC-type ATPase